MLKNCRVHTVLPVSDLDRAREFYENTLKIPPKAELGSGVFYDCGERTRFALSKSAGRSSGGHTQMGFVTDDIVTEVTDLKARGVVFEEYDTPAIRTVDGIADVGQLRAAWFKDTEGNVVAIMEPVEPLD
jgi:catechol 2,3-dioxygenase-like lactoylglutathione lyase family enzyme